MSGLLATKVFEQARDLRFALTGSSTWSSKIGEREDLALADELLVEVGVE
jgi:hypothetical protein